MTSPDAQPTEPRLPSFAVIVPAYNEENGIAECVQRVAAVLTSLPNEAQMIVVDDGSSDATGPVLGELGGREPRLTVIQHERNRGYGAALRTGVTEASRRGFDYVVFMDSDLTNDPADLPRFAEHMSESIDVIKASRYIPGGGPAGVPRWRVELSRAGNLVARVLFRIPIRDCTNGFRAVRTELLVPLEFRENGFAIILEELYHLRPIAQTYVEVPVLLTNRGRELRPSSFSYTPRALARYLRYPVLSAARELASRRRRHAPA